MFAHVRWFVENQTDTLVNNIGLPGWSFVVAVVIGFILTVSFLENFKLIKPVLANVTNRLKPLKKYVPTLTRISLGIILIASFKQDYFLAPNIAQELQSIEYLAVISALIGVMLVLGIFVRISSILLAVVYLLSFFSLDWLLVLEHLEYLGLALFLIISGAGPFRIKVFDRFDLEYNKKHRNYAVPAFRISVGFSLALLAISEKLLNFDIAEEFLNSHNWNMLSTFGVSDHNFIIFAGAMELAIGIALILNKGTKLVTAMVLGMFVLTALLLGADEVVGHAFAVGLVIAVWTNFVPTKKYA